MIPKIPSDFGSLRVSGKQAATFLQGQLTCDVNALMTGNQQLAAHCNPQGRVISLFYLSLVEHDYYLCMPDDILDLTANALKKYAVFFQVKIDIIHSSSPDKQNELQKYERIKAGIPFIHPATSGKCLPQELNLDVFGAISYDKGCYTGQEIIARLHYRGKVKSTLCMIHLRDGQHVKPGALIATGSTQSPQECGITLECCRIDSDDYIALAVIDDAQQKHSLFISGTNEQITVYPGK